MDDILKKLFGDQEGELSEDAKSQLMEAVQTSARELAESSDLLQEKVDLALEAQSKEHVKLLEQINEHYSKEKETLQEEYDTVAAQKITETFNAVEADRTRKAEQLIEHYEHKLSDDVIKNRDLVIEGVNTYFDKWLEDKVPTKFIEEAARKDYSEELLNKIGSLVGYNNSVDDEIRNGISDARDQIIALQEENEKLKTEKYLKEATEKLPLEQKTFIVESMQGKSLDYIKRNLDYSKVLFEKQENEKVLEEKNATKVATIIPQNNQKVLEEKVSQQLTGEEVPNTAIAGWANALKQTNPFGNNWK